MKKFQVVVYPSKGKIIDTKMSVDIEPTESRDGTATLWCEKCQSLEGTIKIIKVSKRYDWTWVASVEGSQNHHVKVKLSMPEKTKRKI